MNTSTRFTLLGLTGALLLAGCSAERKQQQPDAGENASVPGDSAATGAVDRSPAALASAREQAAQQAGGTLKPAPAPVQGSASALAQAAAQAAQVSAEAKSAHTDCSAKVWYANDWATRLPPQLPVYPKASLREAAGITGQGCALRVVNFATPVAVSDVLSFYYTKTAAAGYAVQYRIDGSDNVLGGGKDGQAYVVYARKLKDGLTEVDMVVSGQ